MRLKIYDPEVRISNLIGANRRYIDEVIPHIGSLMCDSVEEAMNGATSVVVGLSGKDIEEAVYTNSIADQQVLDFVDLSEPERISGAYKGICW
jgi:GDP-mannose 6-dehydrogenase